MNNFIQFILGQGPIAIFILITLISVFGAIAKKVKEQAATRKVEQERQRRHAEAVRTGRVDQVPDVGAQQAAEVEARRQRLAEIQKKRQAQLGELRRRRQAQMRQQGGTAAPAGSAAPQPATSASRVVSRAPLPGARTGTAAPAGPVSPIPSRSAGPGAPPSVPHRAGRRPGARPPRATAQEAPAEPAHVPLTERRSLITDKVRSKPVRKQAQPAPLIGSSDDLRRAIVLAEMLGPPLALRDDLSGGR